MMPDLSPAMTAEGFPRMGDLLDKVTSPKCPYR